MSSKDSETKEIERGTLSRRQVMQRGAVIGGAIWIPPIVQSLRIPAHAQVGSPQPCIEETGRMTGRGKVGSAPEVTYGISGAGGGEQGVHCVGSAGDTISLSWKTGSTTYQFISTAITSVTCALNPGFPAPDPDQANFNETLGTADGTLTISGQPAQTATLSFDFIDGGEGGSTNDHTAFTVVGATSGQVLNIPLSPINSGNIQSHGNFAFGNACAPTA